MFITFYGYYGYIVLCLFIITVVDSVAQEYKYKFRFCLNVKSYFNIYLVWPKQICSNSEQHMIKIKTSQGVNKNPLFIVDLRFYS